MTNRNQSAIILHVPFTTTLLVRMCWCGSMAEQLICNQQVDGSTPFTSSNNMGDFPSGQRGQTVNLLSLTSVVRIHHPPPTQTPTAKAVGVLCWWRMVVRGHRCKCPVALRFHSRNRDTCPLQGVFAERIIVRQRCGHESAIPIQYQSPDRLFPVVFCI